MLKVLVKLMALCNFGGEGWEEVFRSNSDQIIIFRILFKFDIFRFKSNLIGKIPDQFENKTDKFDLFRVLVQIQTEVVGAYRFRTNSLVSPSFPFFTVFFSLLLWPFQLQTFFRKEHSETFHNCTRFWGNKKVYEHILKLFSLFKRQVSIIQANTLQSFKLLQDSDFFQLSQKCTKKMSIFKMCVLKNVQDKWYQE